MKKYVLIVTALLGLVLAGCGGKNARAAADSKATSAAGQEAVAEAAAGDLEVYLETAARDAAEAALTAAAGWKPGDAGPQGGFIYYAEGGDYCEALPPEKAVGAGDPLPAGWVVPDMEDLALIYEAVQKSGAADYGTAWYISVNKSGGKNRYFRMSDGQETTGAAAGRKIGVRAFDAASVAAADGSSPPPPRAEVVPAAANTQGYKVGGPGPNGGVVYSVSGAYMEVTRPDKALYYETYKENPKPPAPWRLPSPAELTQIRAALQTSGLADYGDYWYVSSKSKVNQTGGKTAPGYDVTVVRLKDGTTADTWRGILPDSLGGIDLVSVNGRALGRVVYVRSFDPSLPPAKVAAGKPVAPPLPIPVLPPYSGPYVVGGKGPNGGIVYLNKPEPLFTRYDIEEVLPESFPCNKNGTAIGKPSDWLTISNEEVFKKVYDGLQKTGKFDFGDGWFRFGIYLAYFNMKRGVVSVNEQQENGEWVYRDPETGEAIDTVAAARVLAYLPSSVDASEQ